MLCVCLAELSQPIPLPSPEPQRCDADPPQRRKRLDLCVMTFAERLQQYFRTRVCLSAEEVSVAQQRALDISTEIQAFLHSKHPDMPLGDMMLAGSLLDDLQVVKADHACLIVPLQVSRFSLDGPLSLCLHVCKFYPVVSNNCYSIHLKDQSSFMISGASLEFCYICYMLIIIFIFNKYN